MTRSRCLTKSRFKLGSECPAKLFYTGKADYADQKGSDSFLAALAEGGYQVGALAQLYYPGGEEVEALDYESSLEKTQKLLAQENVIIYEAAFRYENLFIRADVVVKQGNCIDLIEVKAKSCDPAESPLFRKRSEWQPYLEDVAFQKYVIRHALPGFKVKAFLMLADKTARCPTDGLNQKFLISKDDNGRKKMVGPACLTEDELAVKLLCQIPVDDFCEQIYESEGAGEVLGLKFEERINFLADHYERNEKIKMKLSAACGNCEFYCKDSDVGMKNGKRECWTEQLGWGDEDFADDTIFDLWDCRTKNKLLDMGVIKLKDLSETDINPAADGKPGASRTQRQWLQVSRSSAGDDSMWLDRDGLRQEMESWRFPLHFIDFETTMVAIPFNKGRRPYESIAFQFSHHCVHEDGRVEHASEYLNEARGVFPNYFFLRKLKQALSDDEGSIFRYTHHENTILNQIYWQILDSLEAIGDGEELCSFIKSITHSTRDSVESWQGERDMIDLWAVVKRFYYSPAMKGSNSIKQVLPAILNSSDYLKEKYSQPVYGAPGGIKSYNFKDKAWINPDAVIDPYKALPKMFRDIPEGVEILSETDELNDGGAALTAYARMQFQEMSNYERGELSQALLNYCELDTMAMVMIYEGWREMLK
ncbi:DUF2779 domain-containing protein [Akkermansiaceae bacterium]|nr:DUF2779 domain-containing protein [Akkermansiaceae bacterium]